MYVCVCMFIYICIYVYIYLYIYVYVYVCICGCHLSIAVYVCIYSVWSVSIESLHPSRIPSSVTLHPSRFIRHTPLILTLHLSAVSESAYIYTYICKYTYIYISYIYIYIKCVCVYINIVYVWSVKESACMAKCFGFCAHDFCRLCLCAFEIRIHILKLVA
jgi:hypothetical protein